MKYIFFLFITLSLHAHQLQENYLQVNYNNKTKQLSFTLEIETRLLEKETIMDDNKNGIISFKELYKHQKKILDYTKRHFHLFNGTIPLPLENLNAVFHRYQDQTYMQLQASFKVNDFDKIHLKYNMFFELEDTHKLLIHYKKRDYILHSRLQEYQFSSLKMSLFERLTLFTKTGIKHILDGLDHLLFILMILMPSVYRGIKISLVDIFKIITVFSFAHSLTLFISASGLFHPNISFIESSIALSIFIVSLMNFLAKYNHVNKKIVFIFGLLHGFGFANVLEIAKVEDSLSFFISLFGFNLGVEIGQIFIILLTLPILFFVSTSKYNSIFIKIVSLFALGISLIWFLQRVNLV